MNSESSSIGRLATKDDLGPKARDIIVAMGANLDDPKTGKIDFNSHLYPTHLVPRGTNGDQHFRRDGKSVGRYLKIRHFYRNGVIVVSEPTGEPVVEQVSPTGSHRGDKKVAIQLLGYAAINDKAAIPRSVHDHFKGAVCLLHATGSPEIDHKCGRMDWRGSEKLKPEAPSSYQPLSKGTNNAKRQHCKNCVTTGRRFDARSMGWEWGWTEGNEIFDRKNIGCKGCYWFDVAAFRKGKQVS